MQRDHALATCMHRAIVPALAYQNINDANAVCALGATHKRVSCALRGVRDRVLADSGFFAKLAIEVCSP